MRRMLPVLVVSSLLLAACGQEEQAGTSTTPVAVPPAATTAAAKPMTAEAVAKKLRQAGAGLNNVTAQDENTDPNNLLGRPNGYTSRASADLPGGDTSAKKGSIDRGLVVETFPAADATKTRSEYIQGLQKGNPILGNEWHYTTDGGRALIRVSGNVKPSQAKKVAAAAAELGA